MEKIRKIYDVMLDPATAKVMQNAIDRYIAEKELRKKELLRLVLYPKQKEPSWKPR